MTPLLSVYIAPSVRSPAKVLYLLFEHAWHIGEKGFDREHSSRGQMVLFLVVLNEEQHMRTKCAEEYLFDMLRGVASRRRRRRRRRRGL